MTEAIAAKVKCQLIGLSHLFALFLTQGDETRRPRRVSLLHIHFTFLHYGQGRKYGYSERGAPSETILNFLSI